MTTPRPSRLAQFAAEHPLILFFALAYILSWAVMWPMVLFRLPLPFVIPATFGPSVAAVVTHRLGTGSYRAFRFSPAWRRAVGVTALGCFLIVLAMVVLPALVIAD